MFEKMFGLDQDKFLTYLFLLLKYLFVSFKTNRQIFKVLKLHC